jgi:hypothetical protein
MEPIDALLLVVMGGLVVALGKRGVVALLASISAVLVGSRVIPRFAASQLPTLIEKGLREGDGKFALANALTRIAVFWSLDLGEKRFIPPQSAA